MTDPNRSPSKLLWIAAGTGAVVLGAAILLQFVRALPGTAAEDAGTRPGSRETTSGKATLSGSKGTASGQPGTSQSEPFARVTLGGKSFVISRDEVERECLERLGKEVLENMINRSTILLACQARGIEVTSAEVDKEIVRIASEFKIPTEQYLQVLQTERNINPQQYRRDVIWPMLALRKLAGKEVTVTDEEIQKAFEREYGPRVKVRMILCDNLRRAQAAWKKAKENPDEFEKVVQEFSIDQASKSLDGSIPPIPRHSGSPNIETAAFKLKPGEISAVVQLDDATQRYVILKCEGRTQPVVTELDDEIRAELADQIKRQKGQEQVAVVFDNIKKEARVDNYYTNTTTGGTKPASIARPDTTKASGARATTKGTSSSTEDSDPTRQTSAKGTPAKLTKPADANDDLPVQPATKTTPRRTSTSPK